ncbi:TetR/AcrR family transcriptional regulator [Demequina flava]|uniref:TetR/AcrR family transcriptional regulator n=1 Tax=Demequina flava TaxID=1095025 RepID=UPI000782891E|nr:TetR/AcrR family transcriptional regulator [Demequina flava]
MTDAPAPARRGTARERLLVAAGELFYSEGINTSGVEAIAARAGVTKATLYNNFRSKDQLVAEYLRGRLESSRRNRARFDDPAQAPAGRVAAFFEEVEHAIANGTFHGCPYSKAAVEVPGNAEAMVVVQEHYADVIAHFTDVTGDRTTAETIAMIYDGGMLAAKASGTAEPMARAKAAALRLIAS